MHADLVVVGGGVVGLAIAAKLASDRYRVALVERHAKLATETSARNSGVIHAGLYYEPGSRKATTAVRGRELLYERCRRLGIAHAKTGKLVLACTDDELPRLEALTARARENGVSNLVAWDHATLVAREPLLAAKAALFSPESGIVDAHALAASLATEARANGAALVVATELLAAERTSDGYALTLRTGFAEEPTHVVRATHVVNAAGLASDRVSALFGIDVEAEGLRIAPNKGDYFVLGPRAPRPRTRLVYPLPSGAGLGVHLTSDLAGQVRAGPDSEWVEAPRYDVDDAKRGRFAAAVRRYLPTLRDDDLFPDYAGVRPKLARGGDAGADFVIEECSRFGLPGYVQLVGIESPGLTASLAIAEVVARCLGTVT